MNNAILIRNGKILAGNPAREILGDLLISEGKITAVGGEIRPPATCQQIDAEGKLVLPGLVDVHTHYIAGANAGYYMLIAAGVTTALDTILVDDQQTRCAVAETPTGIHALAMYLLKPGLSLSGQDPTDDELQRVIRRAHDEGFWGVKIAGAHFPMTPEATGRAIRIAADLQVPLMIHAGSTESRDNLHGMREVVALAEENPFILAHVNAYCDGKENGSQCADAVEALKLLDAHPNIVSESTLSPLSCMGTSMVNGVPESLCMHDVLINCGFPATYEGLIAALATGALAASGPSGNEFVFLSPEESVARCREREGKVTIGVKRHGMDKNLVIAAARRDNGKGPFTVNAFSTDGGVIPRNVVLKHGLTLVEAQAFTLTEFVEKSAGAGAALLGLDGKKGVIAEGADGDVIIVNAADKCPAYTISAGRIVYAAGKFHPAANEYITSERTTTPWFLA